MQHHQQLPSVAHSFADHMTKNVYEQFITHTLHSSILIHSLFPIFIQFDRAIRRIHILNIGPQTLQFTDTVQWSSYIKNEKIMCTTILHQLETVCKYIEYRLLLPPPFHRPPSIRTAFKTQSNQYRRTNDGPDTMAIGQLAILYL